MWAKTVVFTSPPEFPLPFPVQVEVLPYMRKGKHQIRIIHDATTDTIWLPEMEKPKEDRISGRVATIYPDFSLETKPPCQCRLSESGHSLAWLNQFAGCKHTYYRHAVVLRLGILFTGGYVWSFSNLRWTEPGDLSPTQDRRKAAGVVQRYKEGGFENLLVKPAPMVLNFPAAA